jgi:hypothetical protein
MVADSRLSISRTLLPFVHAGIALSLLLHLYLPHWAEARKRDIAEQTHIEAEARAGRWPPVNVVGFEPCYFGTPKEITAMLPANLPSVVIAGVLVVPSNARDRLLEPTPGRILPTTRVLIFVAVFTAVVAQQWYWIALFAKPPRTSVVWQNVLYIAPIAFVPLGLVSRGKSADLFRLGALPFWGFVFVGTLLRYWKRRAVRGSQHTPDSDETKGR